MTPETRALINQRGQADAVEAAFRQDHVAPKLTGTACGAHSFFVQGEPISWARGGRNAGRTFTPQRVRDAEAVIAVEWFKQFPACEPTDAAVSLEVKFFNRTRVRRDIDNQVKLVMDALNGVAWVDDRQVTRLVAERIQLTDADDVAGTWIKVEAI